MYLHETSVSVAESAVQELRQDTLSVLAQTKVLIATAVSTPSGHSSSGLSRTLSISVEKTNCLERENQTGPKDRITGGSICRFSLENQYFVKQMGTISNMSEWTPYLTTLFILDFQENVFT